MSEKEFLDALKEINASLEEGRKRDKELATVIKELAHTTLGPSDRVNGKPSS